MKVENNEHRYGNLPEDDPLWQRVFGLPITLTAKELEDRCPWWGYIGQDDALLSSDRTAKASTEAQRQWEWVKETQIPGFAISPLPHVFLCNRKKAFATLIFSDDGELTYPEHGDWVALGIIHPDDVAIERRWESIKLDLGEAFDQAPFSGSWSYRDIARTVAADYSVNGLDMPNPRVYWPDGTLAYTKKGDRYPVGPWLKRLFRAGLLATWNDARFSAQRVERLFQFLDHHHAHGNSPDRFVRYIEDLTLAPPADMDAAVVHHLMAWSTAKHESQRKPKLLAERFNSPAQYRYFMDLLKERGLVDAGDNFVPAFNAKGKLMGAYCGAAENPRVRFSTGNLNEIVMTLNMAFPTLELSPARPQDIVDSKGYKDMRDLFARAGFKK